MQTGDRRVGHMAGPGAVEPGCRRRRRRAVDTADKIDGGFQVALADAVGSLTQFVGTGLECVISNTIQDVSRKEQ